MDTKKTKPVAKPLDPNAAYLDANEAAEFIRTSPQFLAKLRGTGDGPVFLKIGRRVIYPVPDLRDWLATRRRRSTSDSNVPH